MACCRDDSTAIESTPRGPLRCRMPPSGRNALRSAGSISAFAKARVCGRTAAADADWASIRVLLGSISTFKADILRVIAQAIACRRLGSEKIHCSSGQEAPSNDPISQRASHICAMTVLVGQ